MNVTIPNDVADAIEQMRAARISPPLNNEGIAEIYMNRVYDGMNALAIRAIPFDTLMAALVNGYEREQTAEGRAHEEIRQMYARRRDGVVNGTYTAPLVRDTGFADGIKFAVDTLGVKLAGVNA